ncbi:MAG: ADP-ribosylglycohydrolase family protein, partial [Muribaculaceae bacterium]|nr:ADP-ribosylglycohydrolase family protein [Muribaculaceae bacterium]
KVYGAIFGYAIGDALGLGTEFMTRKEATRHYPAGLTDYSMIIRDAHRSQWKRGDFSTDTVMLEKQIESLVENNGIDYKDTARRFRSVYEDSTSDLTNNLRWVLSQPTYVDDPFGTTERVWGGMAKFNASGEGLNRALIAGMWNENLPQTAIAYCNLTHKHPRCEAASAIIATMAASLMWEDKEASYDKLVAVAKEINPDTIRYVELAKHGELTDLHLDDPDTLWFVRKVMGAALWAIWHCDSPTEGLYAIVNEAGDADTNAALAQGLLGLKYGLSALDPKLIDGLREKDKIGKIAERFTAALEWRAPQINK